METPQQLETTGAEGESLRYNYKPLNPRNHEFRVLELMPSEDVSASTQCRLIHAELSAPPAYEAVSYVWGDPKEPITITLDGCKVQVTRSLGTALKYFRLQNATRTLWVDALCINQSDEVEKSSQVQQMRKIYLTCKQVIIWLGENAIDDTKEILAHFATLEDAVAAMPYFAGLEDRLYRFFYRPWWTRFWILQEVIHNRPVSAYFGFYNIDFDDLSQRYLFFDTIMRLWQEKIIKADDIERPSALRRYINMFGMIAGVHNPVYSMFDNRKMIKYDDSYEMGIETALQLFRTQKCTDARDKVFAVLGLVDKEEADRIVVDYQADKRSVFTAAMKILLNAKSLYALTFVQSPDRIISSSDLPSWVADWTTQQDYFSSSRYAIDEFDAGNRGGSDGGFPLRYVPDRPETLIISGVAVGCVDRVVWFELNKDNQWSESPLTRIKVFSYLRTTSESNQGLPELDTDAMTIINSSWGPPMVEAGDLIIICQVSTVPLILRKNNESYLFVGACCLIDSELQGVEDESTGFALDPGFSKIMNGSAWDKDAVREFYVD